MCIRDRFKGGLGYVNIITSMLFGGIQGSGAADASAIGGMLIPAMEKQGYDKDYAVAVTAGSSMLSPIIPPSIAMILYSFYTETPVAKLFLGGVIPGILIGFLQCGEMCIRDSSGRDHYHGGAVRCRSRSLHTGDLQRGCDRHEGDDRERDLQQ